MKIRNKYIIRKLHRRAPQLMNHNNHELVKKYQHFKNQCNFDDNQEIFLTWLLSSFGIVGILIVLNLIISLLSNRSELLFDMTTMVYIVVGSFLATINFFVSSILSLNIINSSLPIEEKIDRLEHKKFISGTPLFIAKVLFFGLSVAGILCVFLYFNHISHPHPLGISLVVLLCFTIVTSIIKNNVDVGYLVYFFVFSFLLFMTNFLITGTLLEVEEEQRKQKEIDNGKSLGQFISDTISQ